MSLLVDVADYLSSGGISTTIIKGFLPDVPDACVAIYETGGMPRTHAMSSGPGNAVFEWPRVQVVARGSAGDYATPETTAKSVAALLDGLRPRAINGTTYHWAEALQSPFLLERDAAGRVVIACNYQIVKDLA